MGKPETLSGDVGWEIPNTTAGLCSRRSRCTSERSSNSTSWPVLYEDVIFCVSEHLLRFVGPPGFSIFAVLNLSIAVTYP